MKITNLAQLKKEKEKIRMEMELTKHEFARNLGTNRKQLKDFLIQKVALPAGVASVAAIGAKKMLSNDNGNQPVSTSSFNFMKILPVLINLAQGIIMKKMSQKQETILEETTTR